MQKEKSRKKHPFAFAIFFFNNQATWTHLGVGFTVAWGLDWPVDDNLPELYVAEVESIFNKPAQKSQALNVYKTLFYTYN